MSKFFGINLFNILSIFQHWSTTRCFELTVIINYVELKIFFLQLERYRKGIFKIEYHHQRNHVKQSRAVVN